MNAINFLNKNLRISFINPKTFILLICVLIASSTMLKSDTVLLTNGGKLKCKEVIHNENGIICKFNTSQLIIKNDKIKEIKSDESGELYQNASTKNQTDEESQTTRNEMKTMSPEEIEKRIQELEDNYAKTNREDSKILLVNAYNSGANILYMGKSYKKALEYLLKLEKLQPEEAVLKLKIAYCYFMTSDLFMSEHYAQAAKKLNQNYADAYFLLGEIAYHQNNLNDALYLWQMGLKIQSNPEYEEKLKKLGKELEISTNDLNTNTKHFKIDFDGNVFDSPLINPIINTLEDDYKELSVTLNYYPIEPIIVIFYSNKDFKEVTKSPDWSAGIYDGKIRIPAKNLKITSNELSPLLKHELVHVMVSKKTHFNAPAWLQEGLAQLLEGAPLAAADSQNLLKLPSITQFPESFGTLTKDQAKLIYMKSLSFVSLLQEQYGMWKILMLLDNLGDGKPIEDAFYSAFMQSLRDVEQQWIIRILEMR